jgi:hypothetical protein
LSLSLTPSGRWGLSAGPLIMASEGGLLAAKHFLEGILGPEHCRSGEIIWKNVASGLGNLTVCPSLSVDAAGRFWGRAFKFQNWPVDQRVVQRLVAGQF